MFRDLHFVANYPLKRDKKNQRTCLSNCEYLQYKYHQQYYSQQDKKK